MKRSPHERVICALFDTRDQARQALDRLAATDISPEDISLITNMEDYEQEEFSEVAGEKIHDESIHAAKWGSLMGAFFACITATAGMWLGNTNVLAALPLIGVISAFGGLLGAVIGAGFQENQATWMDNAIQEGKFLLAIHSENRAEAKRAETILRACHAYDVHHY